MPINFDNVKNLPSNPYCPDGGTRTTNGTCSDGGSIGAQLGGVHKQNPGGIGALMGGVTPDSLSDLGLGLAIEHSVDIPKPPLKKGIIPVPDARAGGVTPPPVDTAAGGYKAGERTGAEPSLPDSSAVAVPGATPAKPVDAADVRTKVSHEKGIAPFITQTVTE